VEHTGGAFPFWLAPEQVRVLSITERTGDYAEKIASRLGDAGLRAEADLRNEKIGAKIREAQLAKVPIMLIVGDREAAEGAVAVRLRKQGDVGAMDLERLEQKALEWNRRKSADAEEIFD
jgi:threonyl-tRNA synthetase